MSAPDDYQPTATFRWRVIAQEEFDRLTARKCSATSPIVVTAVVRVPARHDSEGVPVGSYALLEQLWRNIRGDGQWRTLRLSDERLFDLELR